jgi:outer membrane protein assembly factor BamB
MAFDTHTGETLWSRTEAQVLAANSRIAILDKNSFAEDGQPMLQALDTRSGEPVWERPIPLDRIGKLFASIDGRYVVLSGGCS